MWSSAYASPPRRPNPSSGNQQLPFETVPLTSPFRASFGIAGDSSAGIQEDMPLTAGPSLFSSMIRDPRQAVQSNIDALRQRPGQWKPPNLYGTFSFEQ